MILPCLLNCPCFGQDSLDLVPVPRWQISRAVNEVKLYRVCDSLRQQLEYELKLAYQVEAFADSLLAVRDRQVTLANEIARIAEARRLNREDENQDLKGQVRKWKLITIASGLICLIAVL